MHVLLLVIALLLPSTTWAQTTSLSVLEARGARIQSDARSVRVTLDNKTYIFDFDSPFYRVGNEVFQLAHPTQKPNLVSSEFFNQFAQPPKTSQTLTTTKVVVIDAGHGGRDPGKIGPNGLAEKTVTLSIATKLAALLRDRGYEVHLTRATDTLIALADRPRLANQWKNGRPAALFVSIHANAGSPRAQGFETYFLSEARTEDERRVAEMENAAVAYEEKPAVRGPALEHLLTDLRNDYYQRASNDFAEVIQRELGAFHPGMNRGVKQAGFRVLVGALMPAVLVETAFISNAEEARLLGSAAFQDKIAWSLARSIGNFFESHKHLWVTP